MTPLFATDDDQAGLVIVVNGGGVNGVCHAKVFGTQADVQDFLGTFVGGKNFGLA